MEITINGIKFNYYHELESYLKNNKNKIIKLKLNKEHFNGDLLNDVIIIKKLKYCWILKGCKLVDYINNNNTYNTDYDKLYNTAKISYMEKFGTDNLNCIDSEIRDWKLKKLDI